MNKQKLMELGIEEDVAEKVMSTYRESIDGNFVTKERFNEINNENNTLKEQVAERDTQIESLSKVDAEELESTIDQLKKDNEDKDKEYQKELKDLKVKHAAERQISDLEAHDLTSVLAHVDLTEAELNDDGTVQGLKDTLETLKEEKAFLFKEEEPQEPKFKGAQPGNPADDDPSGKVDPSKMSYSEFEEYIESQK